MSAYESLALGYTAQTVIVAVFLGAAASSGAIARAWASWRSRRRTLARLR